MSSLKRWLTTTTAMAAMSGVNLYDETPRRVKCVKSLTPCEIAAKAKERKRIVQLKKLK